ncbi:unnamed protein product [Fraxinus pennsylvanica]|uniref:Uncharacterized protein n=1 Tax=Fraxinus pennsylvanica TaxID=56036 RepID=A0AAD1ZBA1_9LAMI|nr:unnamed protein product [Fraxinus pennsylvanica]
MTVFALDDTSIFFDGGCYSSTDHGGWPAAEHIACIHVVAVLVVVVQTVQSCDVWLWLWSFETFKPMHDKWKSNIEQHLKIAGENQLAQCLLNATLHGALILVVQCKIVSYSGMCGIMVRETKETFGIITQDNKFRAVPKKLSVFMFQADSWKITLDGDNLTSRNLVP